MQLVVALGCIYVFRPFKNKRTWFFVLGYVICLHSSYLFLFSPPAVSPHVRIFIEYTVLYPFFIYMLMCLVLTPFFIISGAVFLMLRLFSSLWSLLWIKEGKGESENRVVDVERRTFMKVLTSGIVLPMAGCSFYGAYIGKDRLKIEEENLFFRDLPDGMDGLTIVQISDIHAGPFMDSYRLTGFVEIVNRLAPDVVAITGDIINWGISYTGEIVKVLSGIEAREGVFAILGNHDFYCDVDDLCRQLERAGIKVLRNRWSRIYRNGGASPIYIAGIDDPLGSWYLNKSFPFLKSTIRSIPEGSFKVLLSHRPNAFDCAVAEGVQLTLAGHTHGGQIIMPVPGGHGVSLARFAYERDYGLYRKENSCLYVNRGLGVVGPPVRINCPREISRIVLRKGKV